MTPLLSLAYLPPVSWCTVAWNAETVMLEACDHYQKGGLRNRCHIAGPNGVQRMSIPLVKGKHQQTLIREVRISYDEPWQRQHWRSIRTAYGNAPYYEHYADQLLRFYERPYTFLFDFNLELLSFIFQKKWGWKGRFEVSEQYFLPHEWPLGQDFRASIPADPMQWENGFEPVRYAQVFMEKTGFLPNLSMLDLLFCCGKDCDSVLSNGRKTVE